MKKNKKIFEILELNFFGSLEVFKSFSKKKIAKELVKIGAYNQAPMCDAGFILTYEGYSLNIDSFVEKYLNQDKITHILSQGIKRPKRKIEYHPKLKDILSPNTIYITPIFSKETQSFNPLANITSYEMISIMKNIIKY